MKMSERVYGEIEKDGIHAIYVAEPHKGFIRTFVYKHTIYYYPSLTVPKYAQAKSGQHALSSLSRSAFETRSRKVKTYTIRILSDRQYNEIMEQIIPELI